MKELPIKIITISVLAGFISACGSAAYEYRKDPIVTEISVPLNQTVVAGQTGLSVQFDKVESDSRCPVNAKCLWSGVAIIKATVKNQKGESKALRLSTVNYESYNNTEEVFGKDITLLELLPAPIAGKPAKPEIMPATIKLKID